MTDPLFLELQEALAGRYSLLEELGRGGMGVVYLAREVRLDRLVAIKLLPPALAAVPDLRERFLREARTAARLTHPHIIPVYAADEAGRFAFFAMAYIRGETLATRVARLGPRPPEEVARVVRQAAFALAYAHAQGVVHRDVKPENILLEGDSQHVMLADFGIAQTEGSATDPARRIGTPLWMAPEQLAGEAIDARADLYALGQVARFALTGRRPGESSTSLPARMSTIVARASAADPAARYQSAEEMAGALEAVGQRPRVAAALERWVANGEALRPSDAYLSVMLLAPVTVLLDLLMDGLFQSLGRYDQAVALWISLLAPLTIWSGLRFAELRRLLRAGFTRRDMIEAIAIRSRALDETAEPVARPAVSNVIRGVLCGGLIAGGLALSGTFLASAASDGSLTIAGIYTASAGLVAAWRVWRKGLGPAANAGLDTRRKFWAGAWGRFAERIAAWKLRRETSTEALAAQPTEIGLAHVAGRMFAALSAGQRQALGDLPALLERLEARARAAREAGSEQELAAAVTALETIRLDLLRLAAGQGRGLTEDLEAVRNIGAQVDKLQHTPVT